MKLDECAREGEVVREVHARPWSFDSAQDTPEESDDLRSHIARCEVCKEAAAIALALRAERDESLRDVRVPAAGQIWWRAALRAHAEAAEAARRPLVWLQGIAGACGVGIVAALITLAWPSMYDAAAAVAALGPDVAPLVDTLRPVMPVVIAVVACLVLTPLVVYFALSDD